MLPWYLSVSLIASAASLVTAPAEASDVDKRAQAALAEMGASAISQAGIDICFPATSEEYEALGKNAVLKIDASSAIGSELPLAAVYLETSGIKVPLQRIALLPKTSPTAPGQEEGAAQVSYYLLPISLMKVEAHLEVNFRGARSGFGIATFPAGNGFEHAPSFVRLDEYDTPGFADVDALRALLSREYPEDF